MFEKQHIEQLIINGIISKRKHPDLPLYVLKYTKQFEINSRNAEHYQACWTPLMKSLRGIVLTEDYHIVSRPFDKFFNIEDEYYQVPEGPFQIFDKVDGSMIVVSLWNGHMIINTLGSFESEQAIRAKELLQTQYAAYIDLFQEGRTYMFEIVYPENQIVIKYDTPQLILLGINDTLSGQSISLDSFKTWPDQCEQYHFQTIEDVLEEIKQNQFKNKEGFVIFWPEKNYRIKFKYSEYFRLHKIRSHLSPNFIWEMLKDGQSFNEFTDLPDEFIQEAENIWNEFLHQYALIEDQAKQMFLQLPQTSKKDFALQAKQSHLSSILFALWDQKDYSQIIWKMIKPSNVLKNLEEIEE